LIAFIFILFFLELNGLLDKDFLFLELFLFAFELRFEEFPFDNLDPFLEG